MRGHLDFTRASVGEINRDWDLLQRVQRQNAFLGGMSPAGRLAANMRAALLEAGDEVIERYRNNSDPSHSGFRLAEGRGVLHAFDRDGPATIAKRRKASWRCVTAIENLEPGSRSAQAGF